MKGKIAFVLGAAVGYVLGTRAGRERYEQIKRGAQRLWNTAPVQRGVTAVRDRVDEQADELKQLARRAGSQLLGKLSEQAAGNAGKSNASSKPATSDAGGAKSSKSTASKSAASKSAGSKSAASKSTARDKTSGTGKAKAAGDETGAPA